MDYKNNGPRYKFIHFRFPAAVVCHSSDPIT